MSQDDLQVLKEGEILKYLIRQGFKLVIVQHTLICFSWCRGQRAWETERTLARINLRDHESRSKHSLHPSRSISSPLLESNNPRFSSIRHLADPAGNSTKATDGYGAYGEPSSKATLSTHTLYTTLQVLKCSEVVEDSVRQGGEVIVPQVSLFFRYRGHVTNRTEPASASSSKRITFCDYLLVHGFPTITLPDGAWP